MPAAQRDATNVMATKRTPEDWPASVCCHLTKTSDLYSSACTSCIAGALRCAPWAGKGGVGPQGGWERGRQDLYEVLGVTTEASEREIKAAYRQEPLRGQQQAPNPMTFNAGSVSCFIRVPSTSWISCLFESSNNISN